MGTSKKPRLVRYDASNVDRYLFFNPTSASMVVTDTTGATLIESHIKGEAGEHPFIELMKSRGLFQTPDETDYGIVPSRLIIELTSACNLRCKTCYMAAAAALKDELSTDEIKHLMSEAARAGTESVALMGGEPFLRKDLFELVKFALARFTEVQVSTNGTILDEDFLRAFSGCNLTLQVSLDGADASSNDAIRGKGSFEKASRLLDQAKAAGLRTAISGVLNSLNYNLVGKMCDFAYEKHAQMVIFHKVHIVGRAEQFPEILPSKEELMHGMGVLLNKFHEYEISGKMIVDFPHNRCFRGDGILDACYPGCHFGRAFAFVTSNGNLVCCSHLRDGEFIYGNIRNSSLLEIWQTSEQLNSIRQLKVDDIPSCSQCQFKYMCRASCRADAFAHSGSLFGDPPDCEALKGYYSYVLDHFTRNTEPTLVRSGPCSS